MLLPFAESAARRSTLRQLTAAASPRLLLQQGGPLAARTRGGGVRANAVAMAENDCVLRCVQRRRRTSANG